MVGTSIVGEDDRKCERHMVRSLLLVQDRYDAYLGLGLHLFT